MALVASVAPANAATIEVQNQRDAGPGSLRKALADANPSDLIKVPRGDYVLRSGALVVDTAVEVRGAGSGKTVIDARKQSRVFEISGGPTTLSKLAVTKGKGDFGGGITSTVPLALDRVLVTKNKAKVGGGGVDARASLGVFKSTLTRNKVVAPVGESPPLGGAIFAYPSAGAVNIQQSVISKNRAKAADEYAFGGAIHYGGNDGATGLLINRSTITTNTATGIRGYGGAISFVPVVLSAANNSLSIQNSTLAANRAQGDDNFSFGGALYFGAIPTASGAVSGLLMENTTLAHNSVDSGEGPALGGAVALLAIAVSGGTSPQSIVHSTIVGNEVRGTAESVGGGVRIENIGASLDLANSILSENRTSGSGKNCGGTGNSQGGNLERGTTCAFAHPDDLPSADPKLREVADYGGPTPTVALRGSSPAVDGADESFCLPADQRGVNRPQGPLCDVGAFELEQ